MQKEDVRHQHKAGIEEPLARKLARIRAQKDNDEDQRHQMNRPESRSPGQQEPPGAGRARRIDMRQDKARQNEKKFTPCK